MIRLAMADDHAVFRAGLKALLERETDIDVVAEYADGDALLQQLSDRLIDVAIIDISMPGPGAEQLVRRIGEQEPTIAVLVLTMHEEPHYLHSLLDAGAQGFALKQSAPAIVIQAIRSLAAGGSFVDPELAGNVLVRRSGRLPQADESGIELTARERDVARLLALGYTSAEVGGELNISSRTAEGHRARVMRKLALESRADLVRYALRQGWLDDDRHA